MKLNVPLVRQPKNSVDCGIAGVAMLFSYYKIRKAFAEVKKEIEVDTVGTYSPQIGTYLIKNGFNVEIVTMHPKLFTLKDRNCSQSKVLKILKEKYKVVKTDQDKKVIKYFEEFVKSGGKISVNVPSLEDITSEINAKRPVGALLTTSFLYYNKPIFNFHFNILTGYDKDHIYANDPLWDKRGGKHKYAIQDFFFGLYASAYGDMDNAAIIKVKKL